MPFKRKDPLDVGIVTGVRVSPRDKAAIADQGFTLANALRRFAGVWNENIALKNQLARMVDTYETDESVNYLGQLKNLH